MDLSLEETIQSQINQIRNPEQLKDFIEQHSHDIPAFCQALENQIDHEERGHIEAIMAFVLYHFGYMQNLDRIGRLIADGCVSHFAMGVCEPLITKQQLAKMVHVVAPYLEKVTDKESENTLEFCIRYAFEIAKPYIAHLRQHEDYKIARQAIEAYRIDNCNEGTFDIIEQYYVQTGKSGFSDILRHWAVYRYEKPIQGYARQSQEDNGHHQKIAQVAFNILNHAFRYSDIATSLTGNQASKVHVENLLFTIAACPSQGAVDLVYDMLNCAELHIKFRVEAMVYYVDFAKKIPEQREQLIKTLFSDKRENYWGSDSYPKGKVDNFENLTERNLVTLEELLLAARTSMWGSQAETEIKKWKNKQQNRQLIVSETIHSLKVMLDKFKEPQGNGFFRTYDIGHLVNTLSGFELNVEQERTIDNLLQQGIQHFGQQHANMPHLIIEMNHYRVQLGLLNEIKEPSEMSPWDAMAIHWKQQQITWENAAQEMVDVKIIPDMSYFEKFESSDLVDNAMSFSNQFYSLLEGQGQQKDRYCMLNSDSDDSFSYETFEELVGLLRQSEVIIRPIPEDEKEQFLYTDLSDITESENDDQETYYFECEQQHYKFRLSYQEAFEQIKVLVLTFNNFLQQLGRVERCYELNMEGADYYRMFFVADRFKYPAMQQFLRLPSWEVV